MRRDSIFFRLFQQFPMLLFELLDDPPENAVGRASRRESLSVRFGGGKGDEV
jgi:predicted transposase YdaD